MLENFQKILKMRFSTKFDIINTLKVYKKGYTKKFFLVKKGLGVILIPPLVVFPKMHFLERG